MNHKRIKYILLSALPVLMISSCSQEEITDRVLSSDDSDILFYASLPGVGVSTRSYDNIEEGNLEGGFSVAAIAPEIPSAGGRKYTVLYPPQLVTRTPGMGDAFRGEGCKWPENTGTKEGTLDFCAFYPSLETMREKAGVGSNSDYFLVHDVVNGPTYSYRMGNYLIHKDISRHADFVGAFAKGSKTNNLYSGVKLEFDHKLCKIDLKAWSANKGYDIEVAGVRLGEVITKSTYNMNGNWIHNQIVWDDVEYIFRQGDMVVTIGSGNHDSKEEAASIMGNGGYAMVIPHYPSNLKNSHPTRPAKWDHKGDAKNSKEGLFFSVLLRVIDKTDDQGLILYPYVYGSTISSGVTASNKNVVYLTVEKATGKVTGRVYRNEATKQYFSDDKKTIPCSVKEEEEIRAYGWAAIPYYAEWYINNQYTYTLDYTAGVGLHAPDDDAPGKAIITPFSVNVSEEEETWEMVKAYENEEREIKKEDYIQE